jgi:tetratricopeptide (TPR) repeat protein
LLSLHLLEQLELSQYSSSSAATTQEITRLLSRIGPLLSHDSLLVRIEAAQCVSNIPRVLRDRLLDSQYRSAFSAALQDYRQSLLVNSDLAGAHMMLGTLLESEGEFQKAEAAYRTAISAQPEFTGPRSNLAALLERNARTLDSQLRQMRQPSEREAAGKRIERLIAEASHYRADENRLLQDEVKRSEGLPEAHGLYYRYGLSCYVNGDREQAEKYLVKAHEQQPDSATYLLALATLYHEMQDRRAMLFVNELIELQPDHPAYQRLRDEILADLSSE